ncbi:DUF2969 domain-containing protein [Streptococcus sp. DD04]|uniref:DUF2969 domain-containing protein n=1 Tax=Streptococcus sp. DD04 TaxID=1776578 RepID=UPI00078431E4|nr:DUF2969 domain-containing protein [Streptococcus sp. DD04]KXT62494.1 hypothetical protein STRDD04_02033 [Streptococcus sp. DD04]
MSKKDKKIEIQIADSKVTVGADQFDGYTLSIGKKIIGEIAEFDGQFAVVKNGNVESFYKKLEKGVESLIEIYNLGK